MTERLDQENLTHLLAHGKRVGYGMSQIEITWHDGWIVKFRVTKVEEGSQAPLKKPLGDD